MAGREGDGAFIFVSKGIADADRIGKKGRTEGRESVSDRPTHNFGFEMLKRNSAERNSLHLREMHPMFTTA